MKRILVFVVIMIMAFLLCAGAQPQVNKIVDESTPAPKPVTNLTVKIIDDMNDKIVELNNCIVQIVGELHICEDSFNYSNSFTDGDKYEMVIWVKLKK